MFTVELLNLSFNKNEQKTAKQKTIAMAIVLQQAQIKSNIFYFRDSV